MLQIRRTFQFQISDLPLLRFPDSSGLSDYITVRAMVLSGSLGVFASVATFVGTDVEVLQNGSLIPQLPLPGPPVGNAVTISGRIRSTTGVAVPMQVVSSALGARALYAGSLFVPIYVPDGSLPDTQGVVAYFPDVSARMEMDATITIFDGEAAEPYPGPVGELEQGYPALKFMGVRLKGDKPGLASGFAQVYANVVGQVQITGLSLCVEVSGQSWIGMLDDSSLQAMPWNVVSEVALEQALNNFSLEFLTPAVQGGGSGQLPIASPTSLGAVKVGAGLEVDTAGVLSAGPPRFTYAEVDPLRIEVGEAEYVTEQGVEWSTGAVTLRLGKVLLHMDPDGTGAVQARKQDQSISVGSAQFQVTMLSDVSFELTRTA